jgi:hypothetical protein
MFVREKGRGGVGGAFLPGIDVFSVQVISHFLPKHQTITETSQKHLLRHHFAEPLTPSSLHFPPPIHSTHLQVDGKAPVVNVRAVTQLQPMVWL